MQNKILDIETQRNIFVIPVVPDHPGVVACQLCVFKKSGCADIACTPSEREDGNSVYFTRSAFPRTDFISSTRTLENSVCAIIHSTDGRVLTVTRRNSEELCLPGGKVEPGEDMISAVVREIAEETDMYLNPANFTPVFSKIVLGADKRDFYCVTYVYKVAIDPTVYQQFWFVEPGIRVSFNTWDDLHSYGAFIEYNREAEENFRSWQETQ